eukprot:s953_g3.t1
MIQFVPVQIGHICACLFIFVMLIQLTVHAVLLIGFDGPSPVDPLLVTGIVATALVLQAIVIIPVLQYTLTAMLKDLSQLPRQVTEFRVQDSECTCCALQHHHPVTHAPIACDRELIYKSLRSTFGSSAGQMDEDAALDAFNAYVREMLARSARKPAEEEEPGEPAVIAMLENPAEDALPRAAVVEIFARHDLKVVWANEDHAWHDCENATVLVTVKRRVDETMLATLPKLRLVAVAFTGYDHVDLEACRQRGVNVANVPGYSTDGAAELCFGLIFALLRHIPMAHQHVRSGKWSWPPGNELSGRRLGIVGTGEIGLRVAEIGKAFRVSNVIGYDPIRNDKFSATGGEYVQSLATIFLHSDIIVIACALTAASKGMVNRRMLKLLRPDSILINCARGAIIDQKALTEMLKEGRFRAGLDVYEGLEGEELPPNHPLRSALWEVLRRCAETHGNTSAMEVVQVWQEDYQSASGSEDFLGAAVFTLAAASLQGKTLLEREDSIIGVEMCMGLAAQHLDEAGQRRLQQTVLERTLRRLDQTGEEMAAKAVSPRSS